MAGFRRGDGCYVVRGVRRARAARPPGGTRGSRRAAAEAHVRRACIQGRDGHDGGREEEGISNPDLASD
jgi:hypothetical protein